MVTYIQQIKEVQDLLHETRRRLSSMPSSMERETPRLVVSWAVAQLMVDDLKNSFYPIHRACNLLENACQELLEAVELLDSMEEKYEYVPSTLP